MTRATPGVPVPRSAEGLQRIAALAAIREIDWDEYLSDSSSDTSSLSFLSGLGLGALVGIIVAFVLAPQSGKRIRAQVWHTGIELRSRGAGLRSSGPREPDDTLAEEAERAEVTLMRRMVATEDA